MDHRKIGRDNMKQIYVALDGNFVMTLKFRRSRWEDFVKRIK